MYRVHEDQFYWGNTESRELQRCNLAETDAPIAAIVKAGVHGLVIVPPMIYWIDWAADYLTCTEITPPHKTTQLLKVRGSYPNILVLWSLWQCSFTVLRYGIDYDVHRNCLLIASGDAGELYYYSLDSNTLTHSLPVPGIRTIAIDNTRGVVFISVSHVGVFVMKLADETHTIKPLELRNTSEKVHYVDLFLSRI